MDYDKYYVKKTNTEVRLEEVYQYINRRGKVNKLFSPFIPTVQNVIILFSQ